MVTSYLSDHLIHEHVNSHDLDQHACRGSEMCRAMGGALGVNNCKTSDLDRAQELAQKSVESINNCYLTTQVPTIANQVICNRTSSNQLIHGAGTRLD